MKRLKKHAIFIICMLIICFINFSANGQQVTKVELKKKPEIPGKWSHKYEIAEGKKERIEYGDYYNFLPDGTYVYFIRIYSENSPDGKKINIRCREWESGRWQISENNRLLILRKDVVPSQVNTKNNKVSEQQIFWIHGPDSLSIKYGTNDKRMTERVYVRTEVSCLN